MIIEKERDKEDTSEMLTARNKTFLLVGSDVWHVYYTKNRTFLLYPNFTKRIFLCETKHDVIKLFKSLYFFSYDPTIAIFEKLERLERW
jgi:hypothetical protein